MALDVQLSPQAIAPGLAGDDLEARWQLLDAADSAQGLDDRRGLGSQLGFFVQVLEIAAAAGVVVRAGRLPASRAGLEDLEDLGAAKSGLALAELDPQAIAGGRAGDEDGDALKASETVAAGDQLLDGELELIDLGESFVGPGAAWLGAPSAIIARRPPGFEVTATAITRTGRPGTGRSRARPSRAWAVVARRSRARATVARWSRARLSRTRLSRTWTVVARSTISRTAIFPITASPLAAAITVSSVVASPFIVAITGPSVATPSFASFVAAGRGATAALAPWRFSVAASGPGPGIGPGIIGGRLIAAWPSPFRSTAP